MAKWLLATCSGCGPFWGQETLDRKIESCSKCSRPLSDGPRNLAYSKEEIEEEEDVRDEFTDFGRYCRYKLTNSGEWEGGHDSPGEFRRPTHEEISDQAEYAVHEIEHYLWHVKRIFAFYRKLKNYNIHEMAWLNYWSREYRESEDRLGRMRRYLERIFVLLDASDYGSEFIHRSMDDLYTNQWLHNWKQQTESGRKWALSMDKLAEACRNEDLDDPLEEDVIEEGWHSEEFADRSPDFENRMPDSLNKSWSLEELARNVQSSSYFMKGYRDHLQEDVDGYRSKAPPPVNSRTRIHWREEGDLMHLTLSHPREDGTDIIEVIGTDSDAIYDAKGRIESARWLHQREEELQAQLERERQLHKNLDKIADILDNELNYQDRFILP